MYFYFAMNKGDHTAVVVMNLRWSYIFRDIQRKSVALSQYDDHFASAAAAAAAAISLRYRVTSSSISVAAVASRRRMEVCGVDNIRFAVSPQFQAGGGQAPFCD